jgi:hypothetical protein
MAMAGSERRLSNLDIFPPGELPLKKGIQGRAAGRNRPLALDHQFELGASGWFLAAGKIRATNASLMVRCRLIHGVSVGETKALIQLQFGLPVGLLVLQL